MEPRFILDALMVVGTGGVIGGAFFGVIFGAFDDKRVGIVIGGIFGGIVGCGLTVVGTMVYTSMPWPSPQPYPGVEVQFDSDAGSWGVSRIQTYTTTMPLDAMQQYYDKQMRRYCEDSWQFETESDRQYSFCSEANCSIRRFWMEQYFSVHLCTATVTQTVVIQVDSWQD